MNRIRMNRISTALVGLMLLTPMRSEAELGVLSRAEGHLLMFDDNYQRHRRIETQRGPHEVAHRDACDMAYVANYESDSISVVNPRRGYLVTTFSLPAGSRPHGIELSARCELVWATAEGIGAVVELDAKSGKELRRWQTGQRRMHMLTSLMDGSKLYVANMDSDTVTAIDLKSGRFRHIPVGRAPEPIVASRDGSRVWVANREDNTISSIDTAKDRVVATAPCGGKFPVKLRLNAAEDELWVANNQSANLSVLNPRSLRQKFTIELSRMPLGLLLHPADPLVFVSFPTAGEVGVIDLRSRKVARVLAVGASPDGMLWIRDSD